MLCNIESGNVTLLLSDITGADKREIESLLISGIPPWVVASKYNKYNEFKEVIKSNYAEHLQKLIDSNELSVHDANEMFNKISKY